MSLQEKGRVLRLAVSLLGKAAGRESILPARGLHQQVPLSGPAGGGHHGGGKRQAFIHTPGGGLAPPAPYAAVQRSAMGPAAAGEGGATAEPAPTSARHEHEAGTGAAAPESEVPGQGWSEALGGGVHQRFLCGPSAFARGQGEAHSTVSPKRRSFQRDRRTVTGRRFSPRHRSAQWRGALSRVHDCPAFGSARHTNTDNAHRVLLWVGGCGTAVPGGMPGIHDRQWPCGASSRGHGERRPTPLGRGAHRQRRGADDSGHWPWDRTECGPTSEEGWTPAPPPPCQEDALSAAGRCHARKSRDRGDLTPKPQWFWLR